MSAVSARRARLQSALKLALFQRLRRRPGLFDLAKRLARRLGHHHAEHDILTAYARTQGAVHVLQVGAHDGLSNDPVREFLVSRRDWRGTLVEPVPRLVAQLRQSYRDHPNVRVVEGALARTSGPATLHTFREDALSQLPYYADQLASLDRAHLQKHFPDRADLDALIEAVTVDAWSPSDFLAHFALGRVDVLVIDVEGRERDILETFPFATHPPTSCSSSPSTSLAPIALRSTPSSGRTDTRSTSASWTRSRWPARSTGPRCVGEFPPPGTRRVVGRAPRSAGRRA